MKLNIATLLGAALLCGSLAVNAQAPGGPGKPMGEHRMKSCSQESDPAKCEASRKQMRENMKAAQAACKDKPDRRACMTESMCAKSSDPAQCQAKAKERNAKMSQRMDERQKAHEACSGKRGDDLQKCLGEQRKKSDHSRHGSKG